MPEVDTSVYNRVPKPLDILGTLSGVAGLQGQLNQNKLFSQEYNSKLGLSQIYKEAIDPATGQIDPSKIPGLIAGPNGQGVTLGLPQAIQNSQEAQKRSLDINSAQIDLARKNIETMGSYLTPLAANPNAGVGDVLAAAAKAITVGHVKPEVISQALADMPTDDAQIPAWIQQQHMRFLSTQEQFNALHPAPQMIQTGQGQVPMRLPQVGPVTQAGPAIPNLPAPTTITYDQSGQAHYVGNQSGAAAANAGVGRGTPGGLAPGTLAAAPPGAAEARTTDANASANQGIALQQRADAVPQNKGILGNLEGDLGDFTSGPATEKLATFEKFLNANLGTAVDTKGLAGRERFNKMSAMLAQSQFQALGGTGTDKQLGSTELTSPNSELSKMGNKGIIALLKGNEDAIAVKNREWQAFKQEHGPQSYGQFSTQFNQSYDPRVFQSQYLNADDRKKMISGMTKTEQKGFLNAYRNALSSGWVKLPSAQ